LIGFLQKVGRKSNTESIAISQWFSGSHKRTDDTFGSGSDSSFRQRRGIFRDKGFSVIDSRLFFGGVTELLMVQKLRHGEAP
jgi:hypothetical protein